jgi:hypothetical protein
MQATVSAFDASARTGRVLLDDGLELPFRPCPGRERAAAAAHGPAGAARDDRHGRAATVVRLQILTLR